VVLNYHDITLSERGRSAHTQQTRASRAGVLTPPLAGCLHS
jgi:hypothetical protein